MADIGRNELPSFTNNEPRGSARGPVRSAAKATRGVRWRSLSLGQKLLAGSLGLTLVPLLVTVIAASVVSLQRGADAVVDATQRQLVSVRDAKKSQIEAELAFRGEQLVNLAQAPRTIEAASTFTAAFSSHLSERLNEELGDAVAELTPATIARKRSELQEYYRTRYLDEFRARNAGQTIDVTPLYSGLSDASAVLQYRFIVRNPNSLGEKDRLFDLGDGTAYAAAHSAYHGEFRNFLNSFGYYDIFIADPVTGHVVYSVEKENDFATSLIDGPYATSGIGQAFALARNDATPGRAHFVDASFYVPSYNQNEMFVASRIEGTDGLVGILIFQIPVDRIDAVMTNDNEWRSFGLGESGETYLVGPNRTLRSNSRFLVEDPQAYFAAIANVGVPQDVRDVIAAHGTASGRQPVDTPGVRAALAGETGVDLFPEYRGVPVFSAYAPLDIAGLNWAILAEMDEAEVLIPVSELRANITGVVAVLVLLTIIVVVFIALQFVRSLTRPVTEMVGVVERVGRGDLGQLVKVESEDEIGRLGASFNTSILQLRQAAERNELELAKAQALQSNISVFLETAMDIADGDFTKRGQVSDDVLGNVVDAINLMVEEVGALLEQTQGTAFAVARGATGMREVTDDIVAGAERQAQDAQRAREAVLSVSTSIRRMSETAQSSSEAARETERASQQGQAAVTNTLEGMQGIRREVQSISKRIKGLGDRSLEISEIVETISHIASQTNLLALNAAIEAAGAGEAGGRFAVVADEIRKLANDAAASASRVSSLIQAVQNEVQEVVVSVEGGTREVENGYRVATTAGESLREIAAIAQRSAQLAADISRAATEQVQNVEGVGTAVASIAENAAQSERIVQRGRDASEELQALAQELTNNLSRFRLAS